MSAEAAGAIFGPLFAVAAAWWTTRQQHKINMAELRGEFSERLNNHGSAIADIRLRHDKLADEVNEQGKTLSRIEASCNERHGNGQGYFRPYPHGD